MTWRTRTKYHSTKTVVDGIKFDSKKESRRWLELKNLEKIGAIEHLERQKKFELLPSQKDFVDGKFRVVERAVNYIADFVYFEDGNMVVEDTKGVKTPEYIIKRKMMLYFHGIRIREV